MLKPGETGSSGETLETGGFLIDVGDPRTVAGGSSTGGVVHAGPPPTAAAGTAPPPRPRPAYRPLHRGLGRPPSSSAPAPSLPSAAAGPAAAPPPVPGPQYQRTSVPPRGPVVQRLPVRQEPPASVWQHADAVDPAGDVDDDDGGDGGQLAAPSQGWKRARVDVDDAPCNSFVAVASAPPPPPPSYSQPSSFVQSQSEKRSGARGSFESSGAMCTTAVHFLTGLYVVPRCDTVFSGQYTGAVQQATRAAAGGGTDASDRGAIDYAHSSICIRRR